MKSLAVVFITVLSGLSVSIETAAQTAPSTLEIREYKGLHLAAHTGNNELLQDLILQNPNLETIDTHGRTPLHVATFASNYETVEILAKAGANLNALEFRAYDIVTIAAVKNDIRMLDLALHLGANPRNITSPYDGTALIAAAHLGYYGIVKSLIEAGAPLDHVNNLGWTALIEAVILGDDGEDHIKTVQVLIEAGADIHIPDNQNITPLQHAKSRGYEKIIKLIETVL